MLSLHTFYLSSHETDTERSNTLHALAGFHCRQIYYDAIFVWFRLMNEFFLFVALSLDNFPFIYSFNGCVMIIDDDKVSKESQINFFMNFSLLHYIASFLYVFSGNNNQINEFTELKFYLIFRIKWHIIIFILYIVVYWVDAKSLRKFHKLTPRGMRNTHEQTQNRMISSSVLIDFFNWSQI